MKVHTIIIYSLCICLSFMSHSCTSHQPNEQGDKLEEIIVPSFLPRKLKVKEEAILKDSRNKDEKLFIKEDAASPGNVKEIDAKRGSQKKMDNEAKEVEYFTIMDYRHYKKRRPIHNKYEASSSAVSP